MPKKLLRFILVLFFVLAGVNHFRVPSAYAAMVPPWLPWPVGLSVLAGIFEIIGGLGIMLPEFRRPAGWCLVALLVAVFPANVHAAIMGHVEGFSYTPEILWMRLPLQAVLIAWVAWVALARERAVVI
ncbi:MAG: DoxX family membrane protein [Opitutaceae bacterium]